MVGRSGGLGLLIIVAVIYFSGAGSWMGRQINAINDNCYSTLSSVGSEIANAVCQGVSKGFSVAGQVLDAAGNEISDLKQRFLGNSSLDGLDSLASDLAKNITDLASSSTDLSRMMSLGPNNPAAFASNQPFQNAIDSFAIGQRFFKDPSTSMQGVEWLRRGARQPQGYGVMSQLALGNVYANGSGGIPANPRAASAYLAQANQSIGLLSASNTPQSRQILNSLPMNPQQMQREIQRAMQDLNRAMK